MYDLESMGKAATAAKYELQILDTNSKNEALKKVAKSLVERGEEIIAANASRSC